MGTTCGHAGHPRRARKCKEQDGPEETGSAHLPSAPATVSFSAPAVLSITRKRSSPQVCFGLSGARFCKHPAPDRDAGHGGSTTFWPLDLETSSHRREKTDAQEIRESELEAKRRGAPRKSHGLGDAPGGPGATLGPRGTGFEGQGTGGAPPGRRRTADETTVGGVRILSFPPALMQRGMEKVRT